VGWLRVAERRLCLWKSWEQEHRLYLMKLLIDSEFNSSVKLTESSTELVRIQPLVGDAMQSQCSYSIQTSLVVKHRGVVDEFDSDFR
jgi:hypothetical protein